MSHPAETSITLLRALQEVEILEPLRLPGNLHLNKEDRLSLTSRLDKFLIRNFKEMKVVLTYQQITLHQRGHF